MIAAVKPAAALVAGLTSSLLLASPTPPVAPNARVSPLEWQTMLARVRGGGVLNLGQRRIDAVPQAFQPTAPVTIKGGVFGPVTFSNWKNVTLDGAQFVGPEGTPTDLPLMVADSVENFTVRNARFTGYATADGQLHVRGPSVRESRNVTIEHSRIEGLAGFSNIVRTDGARFADNDLKTIREGLDIVGGRNIVVERNRFEDFRPFGGDHADAVQFFTTGLTRPGETAARDVTIRDNLIIAAGHAQGVFSGDEADLAASGRGYARFTIEGNIVIGAGWHGITAWQIDDVTIRNNRLFRVKGEDTMDSRIAISGGSGTMSGNEANAFILKAPVQQAGNKQQGELPRARIDAVIAEWMARFRKD